MNDSKSDYPDNLKYGGFSAMTVTAKIKSKSIRGVLTIPHQFEKPSPGILLVHGGPGLPSNHSGDDRRAPMATPRGMIDAKMVRLHLCRKYPVLSADFTSDYPGDPGALPWIREFFRLLNDHPAVDPGRICLIGPSHGGYLVLRAAADESALVKPKCIVAFSPFVDVALLMRFWDLQISRKVEVGKLTREGLKIARLKLGWPRNKNDETARLYRQLSVLDKVDKLKCPLLLIHGASDRVVPRHHSTLLQAALARCQRKPGLVSPTGEKTGGHFIFGLNPDVWVYADSFLKTAL